MRLRLWVLVWLWLTRLRAGEAAPRPAKASTPRAVGPLFIDRPDFFDYPDSDRDSLLAVAQFIGEKPVVFVPSDSSSRFFHHILMGAMVVAFLFLLFQFCTHMSFQKGA
ncbi:fertilization-influencing membrane protein-like [Ochotona curzoniae]|uniref:fertilization-influencing membrane protein n=1 Tax=Ochotona curzoniae TaxID=130825 RepID=UPI001B34E73D|nr:fertilization-influencing membrane protein [Ochotona curzoniae]XP_040853637.1 fertilization-influencing membrane protein-like [Ochotona curzoniae]